MRASAQLSADPPTFKGAYEAHFPHVWHTLRRLGVRQADLEDATHDVFVVVHRRWADFDPSRPVKPWLTGIAYRVAADERRRARHRREQVSEPGFAHDQPAKGRTPDELVAARQARALVQAALDGLDFDKRVVFVMHELEGMSAPEIAAVVEVPVNTVYSRLRAARARFKQAVKRRGRG